MIIHINSIAELKEKIASGRVLVDFFATWCGPCKMLAPVLEDIDQKGEAGDLLIVKVDVDEAGEIAAAYGIQSIPTLFLFDNGKLINKALGYMPKPQMLQFLK